MDEYDVSCITKPDCSIAHEHIAPISHMGSQWRICRVSEISPIESKAESLRSVD